MAVRKVMIIRHGEKPPKVGPPPHGIGLDGVHSPDELTPAGWQRAGALATLFAPRDGRRVRVPLERPTAVFAAGSSVHSPSRRARSTVGPMSLNLGPRIPFTILSPPGDEVEAARQILASDAEVCLVCWEHKRIKDLVGELTDDTVRAPRWHGTRFDVVFVLSREDATWSFEEVPQLLLSSDLTSSVSIAASDAIAGEDD